MDFEPPEELRMPQAQLRHIGNCPKADPAYGNGIADALKITLSDVPA